MPQTKNPYIRYKLLDKCFRDRHRKYFIEDLRTAVEDYMGYPVSERQIRDDITFMQCTDGWEIPLEKLHDGHKIYYRYKDPDFSIFNLPITQKEMDMLHDAIEMLSRFKGIPRYEWIEETLYHFQETFNLSDNLSGAVVFSQNPELKGLQFFEVLIDSIVSKNVLIISYHKFGGESRDRVIHPYQLRQYNNRWFLVGYEQKLEKRFPVVVLPIDRIEEVRPDMSLIYQEYLGADLEDYFKDIVGVSLAPDRALERVILKVSRPEADYINTKPLHRSQRVVEEAEAYMVFELKIKVNYEFETLLMGHAQFMSIIEPISLHDSIRKRAELILKNV